VEEGCVLRQRGVMKAGDKGVLTIIDKMALTKTRQKSGVFCANLSGFLGLF
jgi:hypothetical protein